MSGFDEQSEDGPRSVSRRRANGWRGRVAVFAVGAVLLGGVFLNAVSTSEKVVEFSMTYEEKICKEFRACGEKCREVQRQCEQPVRLRVPEAYLSFRDPWSGRRQRDIYLKVAYPSMQPWSLGGRPAEGGSPLYEIDVWVSVRGIENTEEQFQRFLTITKATRQEALVEGMAHFRAPAGGYSGDLFVPDDRPTTSYYDCAREWTKADGTPAAVRCTAHSGIGHLGVRYSFPKAELSKRHEIKERVFKLLEGFGAGTDIR
jgi:hypothetical protein